MSEETHPEKLASAALPLIADTSTFHPLMHKYLSYRACGFGVRESGGLAGINEKTVRRWRESNSEFRRLDTTDIRELVEGFAHKYLGVEFIRNYRLVLKKDFEVLVKSIHGQSLSSQENQYLLKLRVHYTPEQLNLLKRLAETGGMSEFNFTQVVLEFSKERMLVSGTAR